MGIDPAGPVFSDIAESVKAVMGIDAIPAKLPPLPWGGRAKPIVKATIATWPLSKWFGWGGRLREFSEHFRDIDRVIIVGGSYFVDLFGADKFVGPLLLAAMGKPYVFCGHSLGPYEDERSRTFAQIALRHAKGVMLRDPTSLEHIANLNLPSEMVTVGADTAWLIPEPPAEAKELAAQLVPDEPCVALTMRKLGPFEKRLQTNQDAYEKSVVEAVNGIIDRGYRVMGVATCTSLAGYHAEDRAPVKRVHEQIRQKDRMTVLDRDLTDLELSAVFGRCHATIGTRMHSTILSMNAGTPAVGMPYEHKTVGLFQKMGFSDRLMVLKDLSPEALLGRLEPILADISGARQRTVEAVQRERKIAAESVAWCAHRLGLQPSRAPNVTHSLPAPVAEARAK